jgi:hypothetical protein
MFLKQIFNLYVLQVFGALFLGIQVYFIWSIWLWCIILLFEDFSEYIQVLPR